MRGSFRQRVSLPGVATILTTKYVSTEGGTIHALWIALIKRQPKDSAFRWDSWRNVELGDVLNTFTIITTEPNTLLRPIHNRMPVIYDTAMGRQWLDHSYGGWSMSLAAVLRPWPSEYMAAHDVSTLVNSPDNDTPECIQPLPPDYVHRGQLPLV